MADAHQKHHDYHIIDPSPWPLTGSIGALVMALGGIGWMQGMKGADSLLGLPITNPVLFLVGLAIVLYTMFGWWGATIKEAHEGHHTRVVSLHLRYGMIMFIASEVMFFVAWFWAFFDASLFPDEAHQVARAAFTGGQWPPVGIEVLDPMHLPLYNTIILLLSRRWSRRHSCTRLSIELIDSGGRDQDRRRRRRKCARYLGSLQGLI